MCKACKDIVKLYEESKKLEKTTSMHPDVYRRKVMAQMYELAKKGQK